MKIFSNGNVNCRTNFTLFTGDSTTYFLLILKALHLKLVDLLQLLKDSETICVLFAAQVSITGDSSWKEN